MLDRNDLELLNAYLDDALSDADRAGLDARLQAAAELRRELERLRVTRDLVAGLPTLTAPRDFRLPRTMARRRRFVTSAAFSAMSAAAAVILLVVGGVLFARVGQPPNDMNAAAREVANAPTMQLELETQAVLEPEARIGTLSDAAADQDLLESELAETIPGEVARAAAGDTVQPEMALDEPPFAPSPQATTMMQFAALPTPSPIAPAAGIALSEPSQGAGGQDDFAAMEESGGVVDTAASESAETAFEAPAPVVSATETLTATVTTTPTVTPTTVPTAAPTLAPQVAESPDNAGLVGVGLIAAAMILFGVALATTLLRRRG